MSVPAVVPVPPIRVLWTDWVTGLLALVVLYLVLQENGIVLAQGWETLHELFHDGRHFLGTPCH
jgi:hypothetical protein